MMRAHASAIATEQKTGLEGVAPPGPLTRQPDTRNAPDGNPAHSYFLCALCLTVTASFSSLPGVNFTRLRAGT